ncbi:signal peptidase I [Paenibacillus radicis (ex Gao et al. 2016)]|uniref:Signal peptidase I n=1 Tax=Paenibacillus radicis (ex Gao et al. 2016) TaxID=1737354 RepID=A0A917HIU9_9BACL|nr:signal peptidase I [Paenibacillus radicis (ex Gao et al. 2016)]GGG80970.1 signal peptidase I [Paenibacillus radicis (ex Gao et al. 2016)]
MDSQNRNEDHIESRAEQLAGANGKAPEKGGRASKEIVEWIKALAIAIILVFIIRQFLFSPFIVEGPSMQPNFETGERLIVNKILYNIREPKHGEVVVFHVPDQGRDFIKRVIALPGQTIRVDGDDVFVNDTKIEEPYIKEAIEKAHAEGRLYNENKSPTSNYPNDKNSEITVPKGYIFAMGDHRDNSQDSRDIGFVSEKELIGRADFIFWPMSKVSFIKH